MVATYYGWVASLVFAKEDKGDAILAVQFIRDDTCFNAYTPAAR